MTRSSIHDVIVVGAGPAGATAARTLAAAGVGTLLIDRARFPRYKACGGALTMRTLTTFTTAGDAARNSADRPPGLSSLSVEIHRVEILSSASFRYGSNRGWRKRGIAPGRSGHRVGPRGISYATLRRAVLLRDPAIGIVLGAILLQKKLEATRRAVFQSEDVDSRNQAVRSRAEV